MIDIRLNEDFLRHYKTRALRKRLGADAVLSLQALWIWAAVYRTEGVLYKMDDTKIESAAEWDGQEGKFISALIELEWLDKLEDGTYALHQWTEHQPWAADFANRSDKARLSSMAKNYPDIYEELTAQGYTGIDSASYAELTAEYNRRGILRHSSAFQRIASESLALRLLLRPHLHLYMFLQRLRRLVRQSQKLLRHRPRHLEKEVTRRFMLKPNKLKPQYRLNL